MKNIHVLPTDKPSRLAKSTKSGFNAAKKGEGFYESGKFGITTFNIYITNDEEIKKGDWVIEYTFDNLIFKVYSTTSEFVKKSRFYSLPRNHCKKIILTTDQDLIKDGVQAIDDEFLEWFINNTSCENVEIKRECCGQCDERLCEVYDLGIKELDYMIIIPKEEPKHDINTCKNFDQELGCDLDFCVCEKQEILSEAKERVKQETLEEAAERLYPKSSIPRKLFIRGAKWQAEQDKNKYSEEEVMEMFHKLSMHLPLHYEFLVREMFKKK